MSIMKNWEGLKIPFEKIDVATEKFKTCIGRGGYGWVYKGILSINGNDTTVAVKRLNEQFGQGLKEFLTEIQLLFGQEHPNVISLLGYCDEGKEKIIVYEYAARGSLDTYIRHKHDPNSTNLTWLERLKICANAARGLEHLHNHIGGHRTIIHRDIKSSNILIDENWVGKMGKISDLGLSKLSVTGFGMSSIVSNGCGTQGYCEPEYYISGIVTKKSDVYSFGVVLFEVLCGRLCNEPDNGFKLSGKLAKEYYNRGNLVKIIDPSLREHMRSYSMNKFSEIAYRCLLDDREQRPAMDVVAKELEETLNVQVAHELEEKRKNQVVRDIVSRYWETMLPRDWEVLINMFNIPSDICSSKEKLVSYLREGLLFDQDNQFFSINDDGKKCVVLSARRFLDCKKWLFQRGLRFSEVAEYPNYQDLQGTKCQIKVSMLSVGTMYAASLVFKYRADVDRMPKKIITIKWKMEELCVDSTHYAELISDDWYKIRMWHFMNHELIVTFDVVLEELSYLQKPYMSDLLILGIEFEPVEMHDKNEEGIDDDEYWEKKLPYKYQRYIDMSDNPFDYTTKKDLYLILSQGFLGCNGQRWFSLCKSTSGICSILPATHILSHDRDLKTRSLSESRFKEVVILETHNTHRFLCRIGSFMFSPHYTYACYLVFKYEDNQVLSNDACSFTAKCNLDRNNMIQGTVFAHFTLVTDIPTVTPGIGLLDSSKSNQILNKDMELEHSFVEKRNDGWMQVRLTKPLHQLENHESLEVKLLEPNSSSVGIIVEGLEFRPVVHDGSSLMAQRSANGSIIGTTHLHETSDHDKNQDIYWEKQLPHEYEHYIKMSDIPLKYTTMVELYFLFRQGFLANNGQLWFSTCKSICGISWILPSTRILFNSYNYNILETLSLPESRFKEVKKLGNAWKYSFTCRLESFMFSPDHYNHACYLVFKLEDGHVVSNDGPIFEAAYNLGGKDIRIPTTLKKPKEESGSSKSIWVEKRYDGWLESRLTEPFTKQHLENLEELKIYLCRIAYLEDNSLDGMIVEGVEFRPVVVDHI